ncbi:hypothetical protein KCU65_g9023, partial [Aureobasidium melanogenum]
MADWSTRYLAALDARDRRESSHKSYIDAYTRLADRKTAVSTAVNPTSTFTSSSSNDEITRLRQDLSTTQAARSSLASQLLTLQTTTTNLTTTNTTLSSQLAAVHKLLAVSERKLKDRDEELKQKKKLVEEVQDEMLVLTMELNAVGRDKEKLKEENAELVRRWMERMTTEVDRANREAGWE